MAYSLMNDRKIQTLNDLILMEDNCKRTYEDIPTLTGHHLALSLWRLGAKADDDLPLW